MSTGLVSTGLVRAGRPDFALAGERIGNEGTRGLLLTSIHASFICVRVFFLAFFFFLLV